MRCNGQVVFGGSCVLLLVGDCPGHPQQTVDSSGRKPAASSKLFQSGLGFCRVSQLMAQYLRWNLGIAANGEGAKPLLAALPCCADSFSNYGAGFILRGTQQLRLVYRIHSNLQVNAIQNGPG